MNTKTINVFLFGLSAIIIGVLAFFILYNAGWCIGDDAIVVSHTGWGHYFQLTDTINPGGGRFYPLAYFAYNILPLLGLSSVYAHFALHTIIFVVFCIVSFFASYVVVAKQLTWESGVLAFSALLVCIARVYCNFLEAYSTIWIDYTLVMIWALCCYYIHVCQSKMAMVIGLLTVTYLTYCLETNFMFPLSYGIIGLLFTRKKSSKREKVYFWSLIGVAFIFLVIYFFVCFIHIENAYDGSHGEDISMMNNAFRMLVAQKVLWLVLIVVCLRAYHVLVKKETFEFWDIILLTGCAYCCGCAMLKLNWVLYYSLASVFVVPAIVYYVQKYFGNRWAWIVMLGLALFTFRKVPYYIRINQKSRRWSADRVELLVKYYKAGNSLYWYAPEDDRERCTELEHRDWIRSCLATLVGWQANEEHFDLTQVETFNGKTGVYILPGDNNKLFPGSNDTIISIGEILTKEETGSLTIVQIQ